MTNFVYIFDQFCSYFVEIFVYVLVLDACGRLDQSGIFDGNLVSYGNFDECLEIEVEKQDKTPAFRGQYVLLTIQTDFRPKEPYKVDEDERIGVKIPHRHQHYGYDFNVKNYLNNDLSLEFYMGNATLGLCIPSTCAIGAFQKAMDKVFQVTMDKVMPMGSKTSVSIIGYKSTQRDLTHGDTFTM